MFRSLVIFSVVLSFIISGCKKQDPGASVPKTVPDVNRPVPVDTSEVMRWTGGANEQILYEVCGHPVTYSNLYVYGSLRACMPQTFIFRADSSMVFGGNWGNNFYEGKCRYRIKDSSFWLLDVNISQKTFGADTKKLHFDSVHYVTQPMSNQLIIKSEKYVVWEGDCDCYYDIYKLTGIYNITKKKE